MFRINLSTFSLCALLLAGCSNSASSPQGSHDSHNDAARAAVKADGPEATVSEFLEAIRTGNDEKATQLLSSIAREKTATLNRNVTPPASDTARFSVGSVDYVGEDGARVSCTWTDLDADGQPRTDRAIWVVRREQQGWRIAGVAAEVFPGEAPLILNFEDPEDMLRQQQWVREEIRRRMQKEEATAQANPDASSTEKVLPEEPQMGTNPSQAQTREQTRGSILR